jgi:hypothetical protein
VSKQFCGAKTAPFYRILELLISSGFPRVINRTTTAMITKITTAKKIFAGVKILVPGVGVGVAGGAFFAANWAWAYCIR